MDYNVMAIIAIIASVGLLTVTIAAALPTMIAFAKGDNSSSIHLSTILIQITIFSSPAVKSQWLICLI